MLGIPTFKPPSRWLPIGGSAIFVVMVVTFVLGVSGDFNEPAIPGSRFFGPRTERTTMIFERSSLLALPGSTLFGLYFLAGRAFLKRQLTMGFALCMGCGYDLRATEDREVCPECGRKVDLEPTRELVRQFARRHPNMVGSLDVPT
ncbi:MAG: hypothetical protein AABZ53_16080 [Planctomycetota bacterium]